MQIHIEWIRSDIGILRGGEKFETFGDPYEFVCVIIRDGTHCEVKGAVGKFDYRAVRKAIIDAGILTATWERIKDGKSHERSSTASR